LIFFQHQFLWLTQFIQKYYASFSVSNITILFKKSCIFPIRAKLKKGRFMAKGKKKSKRIIEKPFASGRKPVSLVRRFFGARPPSVSKLFLPRAPNSQCEQLKQREAR
jgi:hypothetical protein